MKHKKHNSALNHIEEEIKEILAENFAALKKSEKNRKLKRLQFLKTRKSYLETKPTSEFIQKEIKRLQTKINLLDDGFEQWKTMPRKEVVKGNLKTYYLKQVEVPHLKTQLKTLTFLLK